MSREFAKAIEGVVRHLLEEHHDGYLAWWEVKHSNAEELSQLLTLLVPNTRRDTIRGTNGLGHTYVKALNGHYNLLLYVSSNHECWMFDIYELTRL